MTPPPTAAQQLPSPAVGVVVPGARRHVFTPNAAVPAAQGTPTFGVKRQRSQCPPSEVEGGDFLAHAAVVMSLPGRAPALNPPPTAAQQQPSPAVARRHVLTPNAGVAAAQGTPPFGVKRERSQFPPSQVEGGDFAAHATVATSVIGGGRAPPMTPPPTAAQQQPSPVVARRHVLTPNAAVPAAQGTPTFGVKRQRRQFPPSQVEGGDFAAHATAAASVLGRAPPMTPPPTAAQQQPSAAVGRRHPMSTFRSGGWWLHGACNDGHERSWKGTCHDATSDSSAAAALYSPSYAYT
ncbi:hypothetical protein AB1Y20_004574 [Prymnesium parvum]|uniref:Uncharacterized protein n=1 Tax=Prymnesium parvum TaxID=97485 RepID=A0AB34IZM7_PRYPA